MMDAYWKEIWQQFLKHRLGVVSLLIVLGFFLIGIYAPFLASSKPLVVQWDGTWYFPLFRYLFYRGFFTKRLDIFFNLLMFTLPLMILVKIFTSRWRGVFVVLAVHMALFAYFAFRSPQDPAVSPTLSSQRQEALKEAGLMSWDFDLQYMNSYAKLNTILRYEQRKEQHERLQRFEKYYGPAAKQRWLRRAVREKSSQLIREGTPRDQLPSDSELETLILEETPRGVIARQTAMPTLWQLDRTNLQRQTKRLQRTIEMGDEQAILQARAEMQYLNDRQQWLEENTQQLNYQVMPLLRSFHWEDDAGGQQSLNKYLAWWERTRINRKDLLAGLIFGVRISLVVGAMAVGLSLAIGIPIGSLAGYYGGKFDIVVCRLLEIWESMPTFFMLLLVVAITQSKSIFIVITVIGVFGWPSFSRYIRAEFFKQRNLPYVEACHALGFSNSYVIFSHILPNAIPPILTLLPFAVMGAITSEAGLSFLGLGEEGSCSWGVLMDEGRMAFPGESYLLWPPAILLTLLLVAIALLGDALRDTLDPKLRTA